MRRGLDYTKALLIRDEQKELGSIFRVTNQQKKTLISNEKRIITQFTKYVEGYISAVQKNTTNTLNSTSYRYSTLPNYHSELGL